MMPTRAHASRAIAWITVMWLCGCQSPGMPLTGADFSFVRHQIVVQVTIDESGPYNMLLDAGTDPSAIDLQLARSLGLDLSAPAAEGTGAGEGSVEVIPTRIPQLRLGDLVAEDLEVLAVDLAPLSAQLGMPLHGVLGYSLLRGRIVEIDYPAHRLRFASAAAPLPERGGPRTRLPMQFAGEANIPVIDQVRINGVPLRAALDTGSSRTLTLYPAAVRRLHLDSQLRDGGAETGGTGFAGRSRYLPVALASVFVGEVDFGRQEGFVLTAGNRLDASESGPAVNIGNGLLQRCVLTLDYVHMAVELRNCRPLSRIAASP